MKNTNNKEGRETRRENSKNKNISKFNGVLRLVLRCLNKTNILHLKFATMLFSICAIHLLSLHYFMFLRYFAYFFLLNLFIFFFISFLL